MRITLSVERQETMDVLLMTMIRTLELNWRKCYRAYTGGNQRFRSIPYVSYPSGMT